MSGTFRDLESWQKAFDLALSVYSATRTFPREENVGLTAQLRRAAVSVEVETQLEPAKHLSYLSASQAEALASRVGETGRLLNGLTRAFRPLAQKPVTRIPTPEA